MTVVGLQPASAESNAYHQLPGSKASDAQIRIALSKMSAGRIDAQTASAIQSRPDIASALIDPRSGRWRTARDVTTNHRALESGTNAAAPIRSRFVDRYISYTTWYGGAALKYHFTVQWNYDGRKVNSTPVAGHYAEIRGPGITDHGLTENTSSAMGPQPYAYRVSVQGHVEQCILKFGCFASVDPYTRFGVYRDGRYSIFQHK